MRLRGFLAAQPHLCNHNYNDNAPMWGESWAHIEKMMWAIVRFKPFFVTLRHGKKKC